MDKKKGIASFQKGDTDILKGQSGSIDQPMVLDNPLLVMFRQGGGITCHIHPGSTDGYKEYGLLICDLVRHVAMAFDVDEDDVWKWVDAERYNPTTDYKRIS